MGTAVEGQVSAYYASVTRASATAVNCWDKLKPVQELVFLGPGMVTAIIDAHKHTEIDEENCRGFMSTVSSMLAGMTRVLEDVKVLREHDFKVEGLDQFRHSMTRLRFTLAALQDQADGDPPNEQLAKISDQVCAGADQSPPQSWFDEDFTALRGPSMD